MLFLLLKKRPSQNLLFVFIDMVSYCLCKTVIGCPRTKSRKYVASSLHEISFETSTHVSFRLSFSSAKTYVLITTEILLNRLSDYNGNWIHLFLFLSVFRLLLCQRTATFDYISSRETQFLTDTMIIDAVFSSANVAPTCLATKFIVAC